MADASGSMPIPAADGVPVITTTPYECIIQEAGRQAITSLWLIFVATALFVFKDDRSVLSLFLQIVLTVIGVWAAGAYAISAYQSACYSVIGVFLILFAILLVIWTIRQICNAKRACNGNFV